jgi:S1-C subfamily serine protease
MLPATDKKLGVGISAVSENSDAYRKGVRPGDRLLSVDSRDVKDARTFAGIFRG